MTDARLLRGPGSIGELPGYLSSAGYSSALVLCGASRRHVPRLRGLCDGIATAVFDGARVHVPQAVVEAATERLTEVAPDVLISIGGGASTGLGKMLRRVASVGFVAIPTTFSGSEMTEIWGTTAGGVKSTGRDPRVRPELVIHDAELLAGMPPGLAIASGLNALAHPISALSTGMLDTRVHDMARAAIAELYPALAALSSGAVQLDSHDRILSGTALAGRVINAGALGVHHRVAHLLGGRFGLPHSALHSVLLPHFTATLREHRATWETLVDASGSNEPDVGMRRMLHLAGAAESLAALGLSAEMLRQVASELEEFGAGVATWVAAAVGDG